MNEEHKQMNTPEREREKKGKAIAVIGHGGPYGCETLRVPHCLDNRLIDIGKVVSLTLRPPFTHQEIPGTHFC
jgi:hypothetical protein